MRLIHSIVHSWKPSIPCSENLYPLLCKVLLRKSRY